MVLFTPLTYAPTWMSAYQTIDAPINDLLLLKRLLQYRKVDSQIAEVALPVIRQYLWWRTGLLGRRGCLANPIFLIPAVLREC